jgi:uncharacterized membrane protein YfcA
MEITPLTLYLLAGLFFIVAFTYSSVGLGGGSSYTALMAIFGLSYLAIPTISLLLNIIVTSVGSFNYIRHKHARMRLIVPFFISSIPFSYLGGSLNLSREVFLWVLLVTLISIALRIYFFKQLAIELKLDPTQKILLSLFSGAILGLIAGIAGIGGGIYLIPLILILGLGTEKEAAAAGSIFIWVNSLAGLSARIQYNPVQLEEYLPLFVSVLIGGGMGSYLGSSKLTPGTMQKILGLIILVAIMFLFIKLISS